jgi:hypothetical protein
MIPAKHPQCNYRGTFQAKPVTPRNISKIMKFFDDRLILLDKLLSLKNYVN